LFRGAPPIDFAETDLGYVGSQHKMLLKIPQGQVTVDSKRGQVFLVQGTQVTDLSAFGSGMNRFFVEHLPFMIDNNFPDVNIDNHFKGIGLHGVYDSVYDRVIITKLDYAPKSKNILYDPVEQSFYINNIVNGLTIRQDISLSDEEYFCNVSWTLSFNMNTNSWISFHSYLPNFYIAENNFFYSGQNNCCEDFDFLVGELVPNPTTTTTTSTSTTSTSTTTTTTTTAAPDCSLAGNGQIVSLDCNLVGTGQYVNTTTTTTSSSTTTTTTTSSGPTTTTTTSSSTTTTTTTAGPCNCFTYDVIIGQEDLDDATGNTDPGKDNDVVYVGYTNCDGIPTVSQYSMPNTYLNSICVDTNALTPTIYYYKNNTQSVPLASSISMTSNDCCVQ
jgi:hypothetical protein